MKTSLYRHFDAAGNLLYVGISSSAAYRRLMEHKNLSAWYFLITTVKIEHFDTRKEAEAAELKSIRTEMPAHNVTGKPKIAKVKVIKKCKPKNGESKRHAAARYYLSCYCTQAEAAKKFGISQAAVSKGIAILNARKLQGAAK